MKKLILFALLTGLVPMLSAQSGGGVEFDRTAQAVDFTHDIFVGDYERFSVQVDYADNTPSAATVTDGDYDAITLTVADYASLNGAPATATITLESGKNTSAIDGAIITIKGHPFVEGVDWDRLATSTMTMADLEAAIEDFSSEYSASVSSNVITVTAGANGTYANAWTIATSTAAALSISGDNFTGGQEHGYFSINGVTLTEGTDWDAETSDDATAANIAAAIEAEADLTDIVSASDASDVVTVTSLVSGVFHYPVSVSNASDLVPDSNYMDGGAASDISVSADSITESAHGFSTGLAVLFATVTASVPPTGLTDQTTYYVIPLTASTFQVSDTSTGAVAGLEIDITDVEGGGSFTFTPITFAAGSAGFSWQGSNDGTDFTDLDISSVTYSADGTDIFSFTDYAYKYIRFNFVGPTTGGLDLDATIHWRK